MKVLPWQMHGDIALALANRCSTNQPKGDNAAAPQGFSFVFPNLFSSRRLAIVFKFGS
jgi:hypothetical protein